MMFPKPKKRGPKKRKGLPAKREKARRKKAAVPLEKAPPLTRKERLAILERDGWVCQECGLKTVEFFGLVLDAKDRIPLDVWVTNRSGRVDLVLEALEQWGQRENVRTALAEDRAPAEVDHIVTRGEGGTNDPKNLQTLCCGCHGEKSKADVSRQARLPTHQRRY